MSALRHNAQLVRKLCPTSKVLAVVKANAYGHGATAVARELEPLADALAVACLEEAQALRDAGIRSHILLLEGVFQPQELEQAEQLGLWLTIPSEEQLGWLERYPARTALTCWLKVNTGMNRLGVPSEKVAALYARLQRCAADPVVLYTHFSSADCMQSGATPRQIEQFAQLLPGTVRSAANSAGVLAWPEAHYDWVRPGYMLYGNSPLESPHDNARSLRPVMTLASAVMLVRDVKHGDPVGYGGTWVARRPSRIATVPIGYGDGYPRHAPNGTPVLVAGQRAALAGRVSMDMITVDVTDLEGIETGSEVILWGDGLPLEDVARCAGTIGYELTTGMPSRTPRVVTRS